MDRPKNPKQELLEKLLLNLVKIRQHIFQIVAASVKDPVATILQLMALSCLAKKESVSVGEIAREFNMSSPAITQFVERLERAGFVTKKSDAKDRRITRLVLTKKGQAQSLVFPQLLHKGLSELFGGLSEKDLVEINRILLKVLASQEKNEE